jgi:hypothetical protein
VHATEILYKTTPSLLLADTGYRPNDDEGNNCNTQEQEYVLAFFGGAVSHQNTVPQKTCFGG